MKICLGTVQFGMDYGVGGKKKPPIKETLDILRAATESGVCCYDTAQAYGEAEWLLGLHLKEHPAEHVVTKLTPNCLDGFGAEDCAAIARRHIEDSLARLGLKCAGGYMLHSSRYIFDDEKVRAMRSVKDAGLAAAVGVSIYEEAEALAAAADPLVDIIQIPYSVFDRRLEKTDFFELAKKNGKTVYARSAFLQGLLCMEPEAVPAHLQQCAQDIEKFHAIAKRYGMTPAQACINYTASNSAIDYIVIGVRNIEQLNEDIAAAKAAPVPGFADEIKAAFPQIEKSIVMPSLWKKG